MGSILEILGPMLQNLVSDSVEFGVTAAGFGVRDAGFGGTGSEFGANSAGFGV